MGWARFTGRTEDAARVSCALQLLTPTGRPGFRSGGQEDIAVLGACPAASPGALFLDQFRVDSGNKARSGAAGATLRDLHRSVTPAAPLRGGLSGAPAAILTSADPGTIRVSG